MRVVLARLLAGRGVPRLDEVLTVLQSAERVLGIVTAAHGASLISSAGAPSCRIPPPGAPPRFSPLATSGRRTRGGWSGIGRRGRPAPRRGGRRPARQGPVARLAAWPGAAVVARR